MGLERSLSNKTELFRRINLSKVSIFKSFDDAKKCLKEYELSVQKLSVWQRKGRSTGGANVTLHVQFKMLSYRQCISSSRPESVYIVVDA